MFIAGFRMQAISELKSFLKTKLTFSLPLTKRRKLKQNNLKLHGFNPTSIFSFSSIIKQLFIFQKENSFLVSFLFYYQTN